MTGPAGGPSRPGLTRAAEIAAITGALIAFVAFLVPMVLDDRPDVNPPDPEPGTTSPVQSSVQTSCAQGDGSCDSSEVELVMQDCSTTGVLNAWGMDPQLDSLLIDVVKVNDACRVQPNFVAREAGASIADVEAAQRGNVPDVLRECARRSAVSVVACSEPHEIEYVGPVFDSVPDSDPGPACSILGRTYAATSFKVGADPNFGVIELPGEDSVRCALIFEQGSSETSVRNDGE